MPPETRKLITFANYSNPSSSFVYIKVIPCFIPQKDNPELKQTFAKYGVNTPRLDRLGSKVRQRVHCFDATYVQCVLFKNDAIYVGSLDQKRYLLRRTLLQNRKSCDR